jgi:transposase
MNKERITLTMNELHKLDIIQRSLRGSISVSTTATLLSLTERQIYRLRDKVRHFGSPGIAHGNRGRSSPRKIPDRLRDRIIVLRRTEYAKFNDTHFTEALAEEHHITIGRSTVRTILRKHGLGPKRVRRQPKHRSRRPRKQFAGDMIQFDGSHHDWLSGRGPKLCLIVAIDDATNYPWARFEPAETTNGYFRLIKDIIRNHGLFASAYTDKHSIFRIEHGRHPTLEEQLAGKLPKTQLQRSLVELGISLIYAHSPQAKGRVERIHQFFQDRLVAELDRAKASSIAQATPILNKVLGIYRRKFALTAPVAFKSFPDNADLDFYLCHKDARTVANDNCFSFNARLYQLPPTSGRISWCKAKIEVHTLTNGLIRAVYQGQIIKTFKPHEAITPISTIRKDQLATVVPKAYVSQPLIDQVSTTCSYP